MDIDKDAVWGDWVDEKPEEKRIRSCLRSPRRPKAKFNEKPRKLRSVRLTRDVIESLEKLGQGNIAMGIEMQDKMLRLIYEGETPDMAYKRATNQII